MDRKDSCLSCRLISGTALLAAGIYVAVHGYKRKQPFQRYFMYTITSGKTNYLRLIRYSRIYEVFIHVRSIKYLQLLYPSEPAEYQTCRHSIIQRQSSKIFLVPTEVKPYLKYNLVKIHEFPAAFFAATRVIQNFKKVHNLGINYFYFLLRNPNYFTVTYAVFPHYSLLFVPRL